MKRIFYISVVLVTVFSLSACVILPFPGPGFGPHPRPF